MATRSVKAYRGVHYTEVSEVRTGETQPNLPPYSHLAGTPKACTKLTP